MNYNPINIVFGIILLFIYSYALIFILSYLYLAAILKIKEIEWARLMTSVAVYSLIWLAMLAGILMLVGSYGGIIFGLSSFVILAVAMFATDEKLLGITKIHRIIFALIFAFILNPAWLMLTGVLG